MLVIFRVGKHVGQKGEEEDEGGAQQGAHDGEEGEAAADQALEANHTEGGAQDGHENHREHYRPSQLCRIIGGASRTRRSRFAIVQLLAKMTHQIFPEANPVPSRETTSTPFWCVDMFVVCMHTAPGHSDMYISMRKVEHMD